MDVILLFDKYLLANSKMTSISYDYITEYMTNRRMAKDRVVQV